MRKLNPLLVSWVPELNRIRSVLEGLFLLAWLKTGRPLPLVNTKVHSFEVDMYWPDLHLVLELDGNSFHSDPIAKARDLAKARRLEECGETVLRASFSEVDSHPTRVTSMVIREMEANYRK